MKVFFEDKILPTLGNLFNKIKLSYKSPKFYIPIILVIGFFIYLILPKNSANNTPLENKITITLGEKYYIKSNPTESFSFSSSNPKIVVVFNDGSILGIDTGIAVVTLENTSGKKETYVVTVQEKRAPEPTITPENSNNNETNITLNETNLELKVGENFQLVATPNNDKITWSSSNTNIAIVSENGYVTAKGAGIVTIIAKLNSGKTATCTVNVNEVAKNITLNKTSIKINKDVSTKLIATISPSNAINTITWSSENSNIATVDQNGNVRAQNVGTTTITAKTDNGKTATCTITVEIPAISISLNYSNYTMDEGTSMTLKATINPNNATNAITWSSSNTNVATVNQNGKITAKKKGTAIITAETDNGKTATCVITVEVAIKSITLNKTSVTIAKGDNTTLKAAIKPSNTNTKVTWSSSNTNVATVNQSGKITAKKKGTATITAKTSNGKSATAKITVKNSTYNKRAIFIGDSITYGFSSNGYSWANYIGDHYDLKKSINAGLSSSVLTPFRPGLWLIDQVKKYNSSTYDNIDYVILQGGHNDVVSGIPLGTYSKTDFSGKYNTDTILGGLETYIYTAKKRWPKAKIGYIINYKMPRNPWVGERGSECYSAFKKVFNKWNIEYFDMYFGSSPSGVSYSNILKINTTEYFADATHLNRKGYNVISPYIYKWMNTF